MSTITTPATVATVVTTPATTAAPVITSANTEVEIDAALAAERARLASTSVAAPPPPAAEPPAPGSEPAPPAAAAVPPAAGDKPYTLTEINPGVYELRLRTGGEVFKGSALEIAEKVAASKDETTGYAKTLKTELDAAKALAAATPAPNLAARTTATAAQPTDYTQGYLTAVGEGRIGDATLIGLAQHVGATPQEVATTLSYLPTIVEYVQKAQQREIISGFVATNPDFPGDTPAVAALSTALGDAPLSVDNLSKAYAWCVKQGSIKPMAATATPTASAVALRQAPPPTIPSTSSAPPTGRDPMSVNVHNATEAELDKMIADEKARLGVR